MPTKAQLKQLDSAINKLRTAEENVGSILRKLYPAGAKIGVILKYGQSNPTPATVHGTGYRAGYVKVKLDGSKARRRLRYRDIHYDNIRPLD